MSKLLLEGYKHDEKLSLKEFVEKFLTEFNYHYNTINEEGDYMCGTERHRSLGDIYLICSSYYPEVNREIVKETLLGFGEDLVGHYCPTISRRVYSLQYAPNKSTWKPCSTGLKDEYGDDIYYLDNNGTKRMLNFDGYEIS